MIRHIVLYRFKPEISPKEIEAVFTKLAKLKQLVSGIHSLEWGAYHGNANKNNGYSYGLTVDVIDDSVFAVYSPHPLHMEVRQEMVPMLQSDAPTLMFDFILSKK